MKKLFFVCLGFTALYIVSCKKTTTIAGATIPAALSDSIALLGVWTYAGGMDQFVYTSGTNAGTSSRDTFAASGPPQTMEFRTDGKVYSNDGSGGLDTSTYTLSYDTIFLHDITTPSPDYMVYIELLNAHSFIEYGVSTRTTPFIEQTWNTFTR
jgi:hypothetical protein